MDDITIGNELRRLRLRRGLSLTKAEMLFRHYCRSEAEQQEIGVSRSQIEKIEKGTRKAKPEYLELAARVYRVSVDHLARVAKLRYLPETAQEAEPLPPVPQRPDEYLAGLQDYLSQGPWPEALAAAVYAICATVAEDRRRVWERRFEDTLSRLLEDDAFRERLTTTVLTYIRTTNTHAGPLDDAARQHLLGRAVLEQLEQRLRAELFPPPP
jgi:transcriptional regulator with XRE-family HTH domain